MFSPQKKHLSRTEVLLDKHWTPTLYKQEKFHLQTISEDWIPTITAGVLQVGSMAARYVYMHSIIHESMENHTNVWKDLRNFGLICASAEALHGFTPDELIDHFAKMSIFPLENPQESLNILTTPPWWPPLMVVLYTLLLWAMSSWWYLTSNLKLGKIMAYFRSFLFIHFSRGFLFINGSC